MDKKEVEKVIFDAAENGRLSCSKAHELAEEFGIPLEEIGAAANRLGIKIFACQLGCF